MKRTCFILGAAVVAMGADGRFLKATDDPRNDLLWLWPMLGSAAIVSFDDLC